MASRGSRNLDDLRVEFALPALGAGGAERVASALANHWARNNRQVGFVTFEGKNQAPYFDLDSSIEISGLDLPAISSPKTQALKRTYERISALRKHFARVQPDVIVSFLTKMNIMSVLATRGMGLPVIVSERNNPELQSFDKLWTIARSLTFPNAAAFVTMTKNVLEFYPERQRPNAKVIPNPVKLPSDLNFNSSGKSLVAVGRLTEQKRFDLLLRAFSMVAKKFPDWKLTIWGEGQDRAPLEQLRAELGLNDRVDMPGVSRDAGRWVEMADVFVLSSDFEGWANVVAEALAASVPVVTFNCDYGPREMVTHNHNGLLVPVGDVNGLADALCTILGDDTLRHRLKENTKGFAETYSIPKIAAMWDDVILEAISIR